MSPSVFLAAVIEGSSGRPLFFDFRNVRALLESTLSVARHRGDGWDCCAVPFRISFNVGGVRDRFVLVFALSMGLSAGEIGIGSSVEREQAQPYRPKTRA